MAMTKRPKDEMKSDSQSSPSKVGGHDAYVPLAAQFGQVPMTIQVPSSCA
jgi:hypothetical protein